MGSFTDHDFSEGGKGEGKEEGRAGMGEGGRQIVQSSLLDSRTIRSIFRQGHFIDRIVSRRRPTHKFSWRKNSPMPTHFKLPTTDATKHRVCFEFVLILSFLDSVFHFFSSVFYDFRLELGSKLLEGDEDRH